MQTTSNRIKWWAGGCAGAGAVVAGAFLAQWLLQVALGVIDLVSSGTPVRPDEVLGAVVAATSAVLLLWLGLGVALEVLACVPGAVGDAARTASAVVTPSLVRRSVGLVLGVGVVAGLAPGASVAAPPTSRLVGAAAPLPDPAFAPLPDPTPAAPHAEPRDPPASRPGAGWLPPAPSVRPQPDVRLLGPRPAGDAEVVVRRGDTLWSIAARHLGPHPSDAEIARAWPRWYEANRGVVGDDPDLLRPGQVLRAPQAVGS